MQQTHFSLFGLPEQQQLNLAPLEQAYRAVQAQVHPDRHALATDAEKRRALEWATLANQGYHILKHPLSRAIYLLSLRGVDPELESNTAMPRDFLMQQMEWREQLEDAARQRDVAALEGLSQALRQEQRTLQAALVNWLDVQRDDVAAAGTVRKLRFVEKLDEEVESALERLLG
ncbi:Fe-S protein assembly co-chaperone HscB [Leeia aquatica]|uniref:Co-chaperone protein HscB homolog n=1 Tax=Leeia aquatica TaxID=2725557 RepID=A0A847SBL7_9NEIS|nr:Fe-S protein assembly co-chaperone HscB [Leeia aquatica]NLR74916.1 Fe-S protein assembly co-chaperone HscB [Leeia aquatica]